MTRFVFSTEIPKDVPLGVVALQADKGLAWSRRAEKFPRTALDIAREDGYRAGPGSTILVRPGASGPAARVLLIGVGRKTDADLSVLRKGAAAAARWSMDARSSALAFLLPDQIGTLAQEAQTLAEGFLLGLYRFNRHHGKPEAPHAPKTVFLVGPANARNAVLEALRRGEAFGGAANFARDLINEPPSLKTPETLGKIAKGLAGGGVRVRVYGKGELKRMGMNALLSVNKGSAHPPVLVHFHYKPSGKARRSIAFVGKGITFDSGGLSLKTADGMMTMKYDMAGSAIVFALFRALKELQPSVEVHGVAPITENMPGPDAYKPGDVMRAYNGKTIEVLNTDAEGRIVLSDALAFASKLKVDEIIDAATLTGAATIALGRAYAALMSNNESLAARLRKVSERTGEKIWPLPLEASYKDHIKSKVADLKNIGNAGEAGTIIGGLFLQEFVNGKPWAHLDIASCGWSADGSPWGAPGATGVMVRTFLTHILES